MKLSIVVPVFNEAGIIKELHNRLTKVCEKTVGNSCEIIYVNDGSTDASFEKIKKLSQQNKNVHYISFTRNFGHQIAIFAGLEAAQGNGLVIIDGDLQDPPELIEQLYEKFTQGHKVVLAKRKQRQGESFVKKITARIFYRLFARIVDFNIPLDTGDFRIIHRSVVEQLKQMRESNKFLRGQIAWTGFKSTSVLYNRDERKEGKPGYSYKKLLRLAMDGITAFSNYPLRLATLTGFIVSGIAFLLILYALIAKMAYEVVLSGWTSLMVATMFIGGVQLITIGIIGEYISRINSDVKRRPLYIVEESDCIQMDENK